MNNFTKIIRPGTTTTWNRRFISVFCTIKYQDGKLSIEGVEGPLPNGNALGGCGQIEMHIDSTYLANFRFAPDWNRDMLNEFLSIWRRWHLNDMRAGTPEQMACLDTRIYQHSYGDHYLWAKNVLAYAKLDPVTLPDGTEYYYGTRWLFEPVPEDVLAFLVNLPDADKSLPHAWRN